MSFEIQGDIADLEKFASGMQFVSEGMETAVMRSLNKTITGGRTDAVKLLRQDYNMKAGTIRSALKLRKASKSNLVAGIHGTSSPGIPLVEFRRGSRRVPSTKRLKSGGYTPKGGISVLVSKRGGKKKIRGGFVARMSNGHVGVFRRTGGDGKYSNSFRARAVSQALRRGKSKTSRVLGVPKSTLQNWIRGTGRERVARNRQIEELFGPSPIKILNSDRYDEPMEDLIQVRWDKNIEHEADHILKKSGLR